MLDSVPIELLKKIASFLHRRDALRWGHCNRGLHQTMALSSFRLSVPLIYNATWRGTGARGRRLVRTIPLILDNRVHSVVLRCRWSSQTAVAGQTDPLLQLGVLGRPRVHDTTVIAQGAQHHHLDRVVAASTHPPPVRNTGELWLEFNHDPDLEYWVFVTVPSGSNTTLTVRNLVQHYVIFDVPGAYLARNLRAMRHHGALQNEIPFHFRLLQAAAQSLLRQLREGTTPLDVNLVGFLHASQMEVNQPSLEALVELSSYFLETGSALLTHELGRRVYDERGQDAPGDDGQANGNNNGAMPAAGVAMHFPQVQLQQAILQLAVQPQLLLPPVLPRAQPAAAAAAAAQPAQPAAAVAQPARPAADAARPLPQAAAARREPPADADDDVNLDMMRLLGDLSDEEDGLEMLEAALARRRDRVDD